MLHTHTPYRLLSDERLARLAAARDDRAFSSLYQRHEAALLAYCRSITRDWEDARDALQSAMASAYAAVPARGQGGPVRAWLFKIAHNEAINVLRRRRDDLPLLDGDLSRVPSAAEQTTEREAAHEALAEVARLPPRQRGALVLRELHGLGYDEIAAALSVSEVNARQLVFAARSGVADSRAGRNLPCEFVRDAIEAGDRRAQRRRRLRAHLRSCDDCRAYAKVSRPVGRRAALALPGGWIAGWAQALGSGGASLTTSASELMAPAKGVAVVAVAAAVAAATAAHDDARPRVAQASSRARAAQPVVAKAPAAPASNVIAARAAAPVAANTRLVAQAPSASALAKRATPGAQRDAGTRSPRLDPAASTQRPDPAGSTRRPDPAASTQRSDPIRPRHSSDPTRWRSSSDPTRAPDRFSRHDYAGRTDSARQSYSGDRAAEWSDRGLPTDPIDAGDATPALSAERLPGDVSPSPTDQASAPAAQTGP